MFIYSPLNSTFLHSTTFEIANETYCDIPADTAQYLHTHTTHIMVLSERCLQFCDFMRHWLFKRQYFEVHNFSPNSREYAVITESWQITKQIKFIARNNLAVQVPITAFPRGCTTAICSVFIAFSCVLNVSLISAILFNLL